MHTACRHGNLDIVKWLHTQGVALNMQDNSGWQLMHHACVHGHLEIAKWLYAQGVALDVQDSAMARSPLTMRA